MPFLCPTGPHVQHGELDHPSSSTPTAPPYKPPPRLLQDQALCWAWLGRPSDSGAGRPDDHAQDPTRGRDPTGQGGSCGVLAQGYGSSKEGQQQPGWGCPQSPQGRRRTGDTKKRQSEQRASCSSLTDPHCWCGLSPSLSLGIIIPHSNRSQLFYKPPSMSYRQNSETYCTLCLYTLLTAMSFSANASFYLPQPM